ncbi:unnamed protein product [Urochloa decumbens]|uniref:non-specific serine/threonine protein kinase n=1 Tax=Urochloa decumbens TaxID=240449 RepID=A0ABC9AZ71_9POAL
MDNSQLLVERIAQIASAIKDAAETVPRNQEECRHIQKIVVRLSELLTLLKGSEMLKHPAMEPILTDLLDAVDRAHKLVTYSQQRHVVYLICGDCTPTRNLSKQMHHARDDITRGIMLAVFSANTVTAIHRPAHNGQSDLDLVHEKSFGRLSGFKEFDPVELKTATGHFSDQHIIGQGHFATVYKGVLNNRIDVSIKDHVRSIEFSVERASDGLSFVSKLEHENIAKLLGYARVGGGFDQPDGKFHLLVVQEYMPNGSLESSRRIDWSTRFRIIKETASALCYIHEQRIIHSNLKSSNILLDTDMKPKICDFGVGRVLDHDDNLTIQDPGSVGYMAPEYLVDATSVTTKCDVYAFGVIILETISRMCKSGNAEKEPACRQASIEWAWEVQRQKNFFVKKHGMKDLFDLSMCEESQLKQVERCMHIGLLCTQYKPEDRPTMPDILKMLNHGQKKLPTPKQPSYTKRRAPASTGC